MSFLEATRHIPYLRPPAPLPGARPAWYALTLQWVPERAPCALQEFVDLLHRQYGLHSVDLPMSTCPNHLLPLFAQPRGVRPDLYRDDLSHADCPGARRFFENALKLFVPVRPADAADFQPYIEGFVAADRALRP